MLWIDSSACCTWRVCVAHGQLMLYRLCREDGAERDTVDLSPGNQYIVRYRPVSSLLHSGTVQLI